MLGGEGEILDMGDFEDFMGSTPAPAPAPVVEPELAPDTTGLTAEQIAARTAAEAVVAAPQAPVTIAPLPEAQGRELDVFEEGDRAALRGMPNAAFDHFKTRLPALQKRVTDAEAVAAQLTDSAGVPASYQSHDQAYTLTPAYQSGLDKYQAANTQATFYENQLNAVVGNPDQVSFYTISGYNDAGEPQYSQHPIGEEAGQTTREAAIQHLTQSHTTTNSEREGELAVLKSIETGHVEKYNEDLGMIHALEDRYFSNLKSDGEYWKTTGAKQAEQFTEMMPSSFRNDPLMPTVSKMFITLSSVTAQLQTYHKRFGALAPAGTQNQQQQTAAGQPAQTVNAEMQAAGPTGNHVAGQTGGAEHMLDSIGWDDEDGNPM